MHGFLHEMRKCCIFRCAENWLLGMQRIAIEFEFDMVFCFGIRLAPYAVFSTWIYLQHIAQPVESDRPINIVFVRLSFHLFFSRRAITLQPIEIDFCSFEI